VCYRHRYPVEQSESDEASFPIREAVVLERERRAGEDLGRIDKIDAMVLEVLQPLSLVPLKPHLRSVYTSAPVHNGRLLLPDNAAHQRRADALNIERIYPDRALAACAC
jgi:hypothetical protein